MRWTLRIGAVLVAAWIGYGLSPLLALYDLGRAVEAHDVAGVRRRLNVRALRLSLLRQTVDAALETAKGRELDAAQRQVLTEAAMTFAEPVVAALITPETVLDVLDKGWPRRLAPQGGVGGEGLRIGSLAQLWRVYLRSEWRGFRTFVLAYPPDRGAQAQYRLRLRLSGGTWRLVDVELPADVRRQLVREFEGGWK